MGVLCSVACACSSPIVASGVVGALTGPKRSLPEEHPVVSRVRRIRAHPVQGGVDNSASRGHLTASRGHLTERYTRRGRTALYLSPTPRLVDKK